MIVRMPAAKPQPSKLKGTLSKATVEVFYDRFVPSKAKVIPLELRIAPFHGEGDSLEVKPAPSKAAPPQPRTCRGTVKVTRDHLHRTGDGVQAIRDGMKATRRWDESDLRWDASDPRWDESDPAMG